MGKIAGSDIHPLWLYSLHSQMVRGKAAKAGDGATVSGNDSRAWARSQFLYALHHLIPHLTQDLLVSQALHLHDADTEARNAWKQATESLKRAGKPKQELELHPTYPEVIQSGEGVDRYIIQWMKRHNLPVDTEDQWLTKTVISTVMLAADVKDSGYQYDGTFVLPLECLIDNPNGSNGRPLKCRHCPGLSTEPAALMGRPVYLDDMKYPDSAGYDEYWESGEIGTFDPRSETVAAGLKRLLPELETRLRHALESITDEDRVLNGAQRSKHYRNKTAFEWLVRYQVLRESFSRIADSVGTDYRNVSRQVKEAAKLVGLTLRARDLGGRPQSE